MRIAALLCVSVVLAVSGSGCGGDGAASSCTDLDKGFAKASVQVSQMDFLGATSSDELYADTEQFIRDVAKEECLTDKDRGAAFREARSSVGASCQACRDELDRAEGD